ncbi:YlmH/Sll1252 family protein [Alkalihalobacillus sp. LMS6]|uniref:YlmH family RNA-binding protein n=1 Tax=Alkalihalobacillus sp. LMS6 TaxID=2924034 RepID=UPI0020D13991|nr:YlmH/Sll1252 family protein [Alkalihalobacillus sp. LMS6]UTR04838.1 YlmH/Sll1252 family protein [Alkalihalobacillus sp. LMS6]
MYEHFRKEEHPFVDQVRDMIESVTLFHQERLTDFLDPRQQDILTSIVGKNEECELLFHGGAQGCERKRALLRPIYLQDEPPKWGITFLYASFSSKFVTILHRDVLGALMNTGLKREKFGDIVVGDDFFTFATATDTAAYIRISLDYVGKTSISLEETDTMELEEERWQTEQVLVSSMRLDAVLSSVYGLSRSKGVEAISKGYVKVNWRLVDQPAFTLAIGDYLSLRGYGRGKVMHSDGTTKKEKIRLTVGRKK